MAYDFLGVEEEVLKYWAKNKIHDKLKEKNAKGCNEQKSQMEVFHCTDLKAFSVNIGKKLQSFKCKDNLW